MQRHSRNNDGGSGDFVRQLLIPFSLSILLYLVICVTKIHHSMSPGNGVSRERRKEEGGGVRREKGDRLDGEGEGQRRGGGCASPQPSRWKERTVGPNGRNNSGENNPLRWRCRCFLLLPALSLPPSLTHLSSLISHSLFHHSFCLCLVFPRRGGVPSPPLPPFFPLLQR